ncbi:MAG: hypothetical protein Q8936_04515 [Bacillota bacterium]|nr:hypothetical protein [Bacillota bacterium]
MSRFLAPIHTWLFNKIKIQEDLEKNIILALEEKYGKEVKYITAAAEEEFGAPLEDKPIEELIDTSNIHGWLQSKITAAETREAVILTKTFEKHGKDAIDLVLSIHSKMGEFYGKDAASKYELDTAPEIFNALNNYILEGMPCDNVNSVTLNEDDKLQWATSRCLHKGYWEAVNGDIDAFYSFRAEFVKQFVQNANSSFTYSVSKPEDDTTIVLLHEIKRI